MYELASEDRPENLQRDHIDFEELEETSQSISISKQPFMCKHQSVLLKICRGSTTGIRDLI